jgi:hypothetical protein
VEEAVGSLALTGVLSRLGTAGAVAGWLLARRAPGPVATLLRGAALASAAAVASAELFTRRSLRTAATELPATEGDAAF